MARTSEYRTIAISIGDMNGIGPEVILKTLNQGWPDDITPLILGSRDIVDFYMDGLDFNLPVSSIQKLGELEEGQLNVLEIFDKYSYDLSPGSLTKKSGKCSMVAVDRGIQLCLKEQAQALVTAPISKEAIHIAGYDYPGHTEFLADKTGCTDYMMMLVTDELRVGLATIHEPIAKVKSLLSEANLLRLLRIMHRSLHNDFGIDEPRIAVLGLNPHAGDGGVIGDEELTIIAPALQKARLNNINVDGPLAADGFFGNRRYQQYDGVLAMYHDQGLIPFKTLSFGAGVNFTAGLPIIRMSPDHGTAYDIAGKNLANEKSFQHAFNLAVKLARQRQSQSKLITDS